jgi:hypothetical protein
VHPPGLPASVERDEFVPSAVGPFLRNAIQRLRNVAALAPSGVRDHRSKRVHRDCQGHRDDRASRRKVESLGAGDYSSQAILLGIDDTTVKPYHLIFRGAHGGDEFFQLIVCGLFRKTRRRTR